ncbi:Putative aminopeptidase YsdC [Planctomycetes bacterium Pan216]|uniref:Aminopeptidase YsdC n=1 Tax=Kolteria novifilia TaxID=2527975 RepID=A0A518BA44_9BACT|nr:Putative aminopeptidase YsdC [Planctomycetes bacterium Pan216]
MIDEARTFFTELMETPSPSGYEQPVQKVIRKWSTTHGAEHRTDVHGNVIATINPEGRPRVLLDGHCDQIGLIVQYIDENGFLRILPVGGWDTQILLGQRVTVWADSGPIVGVIARKAPHLLKTEERKKVPEVTDLWVDVGAKSQEEIAEVVSIGDPVTVALGFHSMRNGLLCGPKMDDTTGLFSVFDVLRRLSGKKFEAGLYAVSAVQEEIGLRGAKTAAHGIDPDVGIAVDVTHATDCPTIDKNISGDVKLGGGPVIFRGPNINPVVFRMLVDLAEANGVPYQLSGANRGTSNDANALQMTRSGVATGCLGIPNRYMHSPVEMVAEADLDATAELMALFVENLTADVDFTP